MDNFTSANTVTLTTSSIDLTGKEIAEVFFRILIYVVGVMGNLLVIFMILFLGEFQKITHWYVLQLAIADILFLQTLPFRISEVFHKSWIYPEELCRARQTVLYFNYYASIFFLMIMAVDRYLAVCHAFSTKIQRLRTRTYSFIATGFTWVVSFVLCIPVIMYSTLKGISPNCVCSFDFPKDRVRWCQTNYANQSAEDMNICLTETFDNVFVKESCTTISSGSGDETNDGSYGLEISGDYFRGLFGLDEYDTPETFTEGGREKRDILPLACYHKTDQGLGWHAFIYFNFFVMFILPLIVISTCYILIVARLMSTNVSDRRISNADSTSNSGCKKSWKIGKRKQSAGSSGKTHREKKRVNLMCAVLVLLFVMCWLPFHAVHLAKIVGIEADESFCVNLGKASSILAYLNSALNPFLYNFLGTFKKRMRQVKNHKRMQSLLSATGLTRIVGRTSFATSSDVPKGKRHSVPNDSRAVSTPNKEIALKTISDKSTTEL